MSDSVSSLYGPGAFLGWLCTVLSVILSWCFNRSTRTRDTISNDLIACLLLPTIASGHLLYEYRHNPTKDSSNATPTMLATSSICMDFVALAPLLFTMRTSGRGARRTLLTWLVTAACYVVFLFASLDSISNHRTVFGQTALIPGLSFGISVLPMLAYLKSAFKSESYGKESTLCGCYAPICFSIPILLSMVARQSRNQGLLPSTPYSLSELDQIVALCLGLVTLLSSIHGIVQDLKISAETELRYLGARMLSDLEQGKMEMEVTRWKETLDATRGKFKMVATRNRHREEAEHRYSQLSPVVRKVIHGTRLNPRKRLRAAGLL